MKTKRIILSFILVVSTVLTTKLYASNFEAFIDTYKISSEEVAVPTKDVAKTWNIVYGESSRPVKVLLKQTKNGDEYVVRSNYFEVKYVNGEKGFGARELRYSEQAIPEDLNSKVLNSTRLNNQKVISQTKVEDQHVLEVIASFLPDLVNDEYKDILN